MILKVIRSSWFVFDLFIIEQVNLYVVMVNVLVCLVIPKIEEGWFVIFDKTNNCLAL